MKFKAPAANQRVIIRSERPIFDTTGVKVAMQDGINVQFDRGEYDSACESNPEHRKVIEDFLLNDPRMRGVVFPVKAEKVKIDGQEMEVLGAPEIPEEAPVEPPKRKRGRPKGSKNKKKKRKPKARKVAEAPDA